MLYLVCRTLSGVYPTCHVLTGRPSVCNVVGGIDWIMWYVAINHKALLFSVGQWNPFVAKVLHVTFKLLFHRLPVECVHAIMQFDKVAAPGIRRQHTPPVNTTMTATNDAWSIVHWPSTFNDIDHCQLHWHIRIDSTTVWVSTFCWRPLCQWIMYLHLKA